MTSPVPPLRVGVVSYLNMLPLTEGMDRLAPGTIEVISVPPGPMADLMDQGELDLGMLPVGTVLERPDWEIVGRSMIGSDGPVKSVLAVGAGDPTQWKTVHPDSHSRTSNVLVQILLDALYGVRPRLGDPVPLEGWQPPETPPDGEAFVLIGTRALKWRDVWKGRDITALDLGEAWKRWTDLPFVYAVWAARRGSQVDSWMERFEELKRSNQAHLESIVQRWPGLDEEQLTPAEATRYLTENIKFDLSEQALKGLARFHEEGRSRKLFSDYGEPRLASHRR